MNYPFLTSKERDSETGLDYFEARYYSSIQARFNSPDEFTGGPDELYYFVDDASENPTFYGDLSNPQSLNKYQYSYNNPLRYVDPDGHEPENDQDPRPAPGQALPIPVVPPVSGPIPIFPPGNPIKNPIQDYLVEPNSNAIPPQGTEGPTPVPLPDNKPDINKPIIPPDAQIRFGPNPNKPIVVTQGQTSESPEAKSGRKQVFKNFPTRKRAIDARPRPRPAQPGGKRVTRQSKNKKGMGSKSEKHKKGGRHVHDDRHNDQKKPNWHYGVPG